MVFHSHQPIPLFTGSWCALQPCMWLPRLGWQTQTRTRFFTWTAVPRSLRRRSW
jgi:hypothetical protein